MSSDVTAVTYAKVSLLSQHIHRSEGSCTVCSRFLCAVRPHYSDGPSASRSLSLSLASMASLRGAVCPYDGRCYRKNPQHFRDFYHPIQLPDSPGVNVFPEAMARPEFPATPKRVRTEGYSHSDHVSVATTEVVQDASSSSSYVTPQWTPPMLQHSLPGVMFNTCHPTTVTTAVVPSQEVWLSPDHSSVDHLETLEEEGPSVALLRQLLLRDPRLQAVDACRDEASGNLPSLTSDFENAGECLKGAYGMPFVEADIRAVLLAAVELRPADPLHAFTGWRLVGPLELLWRVYCWQVEHPQATCPSAGSFFLDEAAKWRCARFRYDPPECMTLAVANGNDEAKQQQHHLCYHRDDPSEVPTVVALGSAADCTFKIVSRTLATYLLAHAHQTGSATAVKALEAAIRSSTGSFRESDDPTATPTQHLFAFGDGRRPPTFSSLASSAVRYRRRHQLATTTHGLGIQAPYNSETEIGYRPLCMSTKRLQQILGSWDAEYAARRQLTPTTVAAATSLPEGRRAFTGRDWEEIHEQFRYSDMANDEGDFALGLELGLNLFSAVRAPSFLPVRRTVGDTPPTAVAPTRSNLSEGGLVVGDEEGELRDCNPLLWHSFRMLDCAYMLLGRSLFRHILRCHIPLLAGQRQVMQRLEEVFSSL